jgi:hypothetical protein
MSLDRQMLQEICHRETVKPTQQRDRASFVVATVDQRTARVPSLEDQQFAVLLQIAS